MANKNILEQEFSSNLNSLLSTWKNIKNIESFLESRDEESPLSAAVTEVGTSINDLLESQTVQSYLPRIATKHLRQAIQLLSIKNTR